MSDSPQAAARAPSVGPSGRRLFAFGALAAVLLASALLFLAQRRFEKGYVTLGDGPRVRVEVAATIASRERGLSGHAPLGPEEGMYFVFPEADRYSFWMKDMRFPIDVVWIRDGVIADITTDLPVPVEGLPLPQFAPRVPVDRVLEVPAGFARTHGLRNGLPVTEHLAE